MHLSKSTKCAWYHKGKLADLGPLDLEGEGGEMHIQEEQTTNEEEEEDPEEVLEDLEDDLFHFLPLPVEEDVGPEQGIGEAGPGPSTMAAGSSRLLDDNEDTRTTDEHPSAGKIIRMNKSLHERWRRLFQDPVDIASDVEMEAEDNNETLYHPFASELDWRIANWMIKDNPGHNAFNRLLAIPGVRYPLCGGNSQLISAQVKERLGLSYHNTKTLLRVVDGIPERAGKWHVKTLRFQDSPEEHTIRYRDVIKAVECLWGDPALAKHMVYRPKKIFTDNTKATRIYSEMWTGVWWHAVQVQDSTHVDLL